jgi:hypothetical protein
MRFVGKFLILLNEGGKFTCEMFKIVVLITRFKGCKLQKKLFSQVAFCKFDSKNILFDL